MSYDENKKPTRKLNKRTAKAILAGVVAMVAAISLFLVIVNLGNRSIQKDRTLFNATVENNGEVIVVENATKLKIEKYQRWRNGAQEKDITIFTFGKPNAFFPYPFETGVTHKMYGDVNMTYEFTGSEGL